ncbi:MAG: phosphoenolpyruvate--protein phosphotransferase, partial [candidate division Zixibacteria bacterium]|nr:phosphoenolpyruvate--protein phosphotransferase [candidate division Zixibacteria bacterium]
VLRTFDMGYDKMISNGSWPKEDNPALGWRGIRAMLDMSAVFKIQIKAILRASTLGNLWIMLPMITELPELEKAGKLISQAKLELRRSGIPFDERIKVGIMVEVPAAAMTVEVLAQRVDFISIGTNDLTQYIMAADRTNMRVAALYSSYHPSVLSLVNRTVAACVRAGKPVSICGEVAGDILALPLFIGMGVDQLSMNPNRIFDLCRAVKKIDSQLVHHLVGPVISSRSQQSVKRKLENYRTELERKKTHA